jgi:hypothetical protein
LCFEELEITMSELKVQMACIWILHGARRLLCWAKDYTGDIDDPLELQAALFEGGPLYHGPPAMCLQTWGFWLSRLEELGKTDSGMSQETRDLALEAAENMRTVERSVSLTL